MCNVILEKLRKLVETSRGKSCRPKNSLKHVEVTCLSRDLRDAPGLSAQPNCTRSGLKISCNRSYTVVSTATVNTLESSVME